MTAVQKALPKGWKWVKLGEVAKIVSGSTPSTSNPAYWDGDLTWVTPADLSKLDTIEIKDSERKITAEGYQSCSTAMLPVGTVLFSSRAPIGHLAIAGKEMCTNQGFKSLIPNEKTNSLYLFFILKHFKERLISLGSGATFKEISKTSVEKFELPLPPLPTQHKIVEILEEADNLRKLRQQAEEKMKDLISSLFVQMFGDPVKNPKGWKKFPLADLCEGRYGIKAGPFGSSLKKECYTASGFRIYGQEQVIAGDFSKGDYYIGKDKFEDMRAYEVKPNDLLISLVGTIGKVIVVPENIEPGIINPRLLKISPKHRALNSVFFAALLQHSSIQRSLSQIAHGGTMGVLNAGILKKLAVPLPPLPLQQEFAKLVEDVEAEKARQAKSKKRLDELFQSLMQRAFTGELVA